ncbi:LPS export ABC transporter periplasmic protein LptC [Arenimonas sp. GDDSR-1]|uniref:LPS export ABC transporter periplasmic protein LptC n=1 Tax=Arenimonas sp. GDDSR-1 TaxID=2950125 RepID=UPI002630108A|nr:LPS export ABC transporter periplasmic protein LptC [Arenimonas sp. GDDSR-1]
MNYRKATLAMSIAVAALAMVVWDMRGDRDQQAEKTARSDYRLQDFSMHAFNEDGRTAFSLRSPLLERDPDGKSLTIAQPVFVFPGDEAGQNWGAVADSAWVSDRAREIRLQDNVRVTGPVSPKGLKTEFSAAELSVFPKENRLHSNGVVTVNHGRSILSGTGLEADMKQRRVRLLAKVTARYAPE